MKKFLSILAIAAVTTAFWSCDGDDGGSTPNAPSITAPTVTDVQVGTTADVTFAVTVPGGYKSTTATATGGTAAISSEPTAGATSGNVVVSFTADASVGAGSVSITVTDNNNKTTVQIGVVNKTEDPAEITISSNITADATWETGKTYILAGRIAVQEGVTLTVEPGVVVKGEAGTEANATALIITRGAKIMAEGTAEQPIIFTSVADEIQPGMIASPNLTPDVNGLWGGLMILGKAPISVESDEETKNIEGIPPSDPNGLYGGTDDTDNSGVLRYVSIRHGGSNIGEGNEINGLTLGGVGSGTIIEYIEVVGNQDDGIEWFGGTVDVNHALVWNPGDDGIDTDQAWAGTLDNFIVISGEETDHAFEIDGPEGTYGEGTSTGHTIQNGSVKGSEVAELADFRDGARATFQSIYFFNFPDPTAPEGRGDLSLSGSETTTNFANGHLVFSDLEATSPASVALTAVFKGGTDASATEVVAGASTVGADKAAFSWTWASEAEELENF